jgi:DNA repair protein RadC
VKKLEILNFKEAMSLLKKKDDFFYIKNLINLNDLYQFKNELVSKRINDTIDAKKMISELLNDVKESHEEFVYCLLDFDRNVRFYKFSSDNNLTMVNIDVREMIGEILFSNASYVLMGHNHPSGICYPSEKDLEITSRINNFLKLINVHLMDHIIVTKKKEFSFLENNLI